MSQLADYAGTIEEILDGHGVSRSAFSRRAIKESSKQLEDFYTRRFDEQEFVVSAPNSFLPILELRVSNPVMSAIFSTIHRNHLNDAFDRTHTFRQTLLIIVPSPAVSRTLHKRV